MYILICIDYVIQNSSFFYLFNIKANQVVSSAKKRLFAEMNSPSETQNEIYCVDDDNGTSIV